jgi:hypothetical protein
MGQIQLVKTFSEFFLALRGARQHLCRVSNGPDSTRQDLFRVFILALTSYVRPEDLRPLRVPADSAEDSAEWVSPSCPRLESDSSVQSSRSLEPRFRLNSRSRAAEIALGDLGTSGNQRLRRSTGAPWAHLRQGGVRSRLACSVGVWRRSMLPSGLSRSAGRSRSATRKPGVSWYERPGRWEQPGGNSTVSSPARSRAGASR